MAKLVSKIYGEALFQLGMEEQCLEQLAEEAFAVQEAIRENPDLLKLLNHPKIDKEERFLLWRIASRDRYQILW